MSVARLFLIAPTEVFEHPPFFPTVEAKIPEGPISDYDCYAADLKGDPSKTIGPFTPVVKRARWNEDRLYIEVPGDYQYWFHPEHSEWDPPRTCWYQSSHTLRFVKKRSS